jgi:hypothetical protein
MCAMESHTVKKSEYTRLSARMANRQRRRPHGFSLSLFLFSKFRRNFRDGLDFHVAKKTFAAFRLQADFPGRNRFGRAVIKTLRIVEAHDDLAVDDVNGVAVECDQLNHVPFAFGFLGVHEMHAMIADGRFLDKNRVGAGGVVAPQISLHKSRAAERL